MLKSVAGVFVKLTERWMPDPLVIAILLTVVTVFSAVGFTDFTITQTVDAWGDSFWNLLRFTGQIILTLALGHVVANTDPALKMFNFIASRINSAKGAYLMVTFVGCFLSLMSWGLGLVATAILARKTGEICQQRGVRVHYPLLVAAAYSSYVVWHLGLSGSIPLAINTPGHFLEDSIGLISVSQTIFTPWSLSVTALVIITLPFLMAALAPTGDEEIREFRPQDGEGHVEKDEASERVDNSPAARLEKSRVLNLSLVAMGAFWLFGFFKDGGSINLDIINFIFLIIGIALSKHPKDYVRLLTNAAKVIGPFLIQYPMYAGLMGIMAASGLATMLVGFFASISTADTLPIWSFLSAGILNIFIPSGGGQWAIQGPIMTEAALQLGADIPRVAMAVAMGDQWTNMIQPLFTIPALAIAGLHIRDIMGYCLVTLLFTGAIFLGALAFF